MRRRDPLLWLSAVTVLAVGVYGTSVTLPWVDRDFAGFLVLANGVVPSAGLAHWPAVDGGEIFQRELVAVGGEAVPPAALQTHAASHATGTPLSYRFGDGPDALERSIATRTFTWADWMLLFGALQFCAFGLTGVALAIRFLRPHDPAARGAALSLGLIGMWPLTATDLYGPYHLFRLHAAFECFLFAATLHLALVFPSPRPFAARRPWLVSVPYALAAGLALWNQIGLFDPATYTRTHGLAMTAFGAAACALLVSLVWSYLRPENFQARQRVKVLAFGAVLALLPQVLISLDSALSGGQAPENLMGWSGIFFPLAVAYAILRSDLLQVDTILRRTLNYAILTATVAAAYVSVLLVLEPLFRLGGDAEGGVSVIGFAVVAVGVLSLHSRIQSVVDRVFFRSAYDDRRLVREVSERLSEETDLAVVTNLLERTVERALSPSRLELAVASPEVGQLADEPRRSDSVRIADLDDGGLEVDFVVGQRLVARMRLGRPLSGRFYRADDRTLLSTLANQGAVAIQNGLALQRLRYLNLTLEQKVEERTSELEATLGELRETQRQMVHQEKMASIGQLVAGVAHEINNPLNFITGNLFHLREYTDLLCEVIARYEQLMTADCAEKARAVRDELDLDYALDDLKPVFEGCDEGVRRTTAIVSDLRTFSRADSGQVTEVNLPAAIDATLNLLTSRLEGIEVVRDYGDVPDVQCLEAQIGQVFMNLLVNAADALDEGGRITVRIGPAGEERVRVEVEDDGCGIPEDVRGRIFEPFFSTKEVGKGTGLGLAISYGVIARHGGIIELDSEVGRGTCFRVTLPVESDGHGDPA